MLSRKIKINLDGWGEVGETPLLIPSFSSTINEDICDIIRTMDEFIKGPILVSAYDIYYSNKQKNPKKKFPKLTFPTLIFIDSGGYECSIKKGVSDFGFYRAFPYEDWDEKVHEHVIKKLIKSYSKIKPLSIISYDHPEKIVSLEKQIQDSKKFFNGKEGIIKEILIKPETEKAKRIDVENVMENINLFDEFDILGFTEKELGYSVWKRMINIMRIRKEMDKNNIKKPIHIFGSLDTITTPLYYFSGADIFDGLSWMRYMFHDGLMLYPESHGPQIHGIYSNVDTLRMTNLALNNSYLEGLKIKLEQYQSTGSFDPFGNNKDFFQDINEKLLVKIREVQ